MKIGIIAGNRLLPVMLAKSIKEKKPQLEVVALCFHSETSPLIKKYADKTYWLPIGSLSLLRDRIAEEGLSECIMSGQITPIRIFNRRNWDNELVKLVEESQDMRPHSIFLSIINYLERYGLKFLDSTTFLENTLASEGCMNGITYAGGIINDVEFGKEMVSRFVDLDVGQTIVVKNKSVVAIEAIEGTDNTIKRGAYLAGKGCVILKFSKTNQDFRFDVPVVGESTLKLLKRIKASALVLETNRVLMLNKEKFLASAAKYQIPIIGASKTKR